MADETLKNEPNLETLEPAFGKDAVTVVLSANDFYAPYVACVLQSIKDNSRDDRNYDIIVLSSDITQQNQTLMMETMGHKNISVRFFNAQTIMNRFSKLYIHGHFKVETYFRLMIPDILPKHHKALYLDCDLVVQRDVAELFDTDIEGKLIAATRDADTAGLYNGYEPTKKEYMDNILKIKNPFDYFQAGVILMNLDQFRLTYTAEEMLDFAASYDWDLLDQDVMNYLCQGKVEYVSMQWNTMMNWQGRRLKDIVSRAPQSLQIQYMQARKDPYIIHYAGPGNKPWEYRNADMGEYFWYYARRCPYYPIIAERLDYTNSSIRGRLQLMHHFFLYRIGLPIADFIFRPGHKPRKYAFKIYKIIGSYW